MTNEAGGAGGAAAGDAGAAAPATGSAAGAATAGGDAGAAGAQGTGAGAGAESGSGNQAAATAPEGAKPADKEIRSLLGDEAPDHAKPGENKPAENKEGEGTKKEGDTATEYTDFTLPDGFEPIPEIMDAFKDIAKNHKLDQAGAQEYVNLATQLIQKEQDRAFDAWRDTNNQWLEAVTKDTEIGGTKLNENMGLIANEMGQIMGDGFKAWRDAMKYTGAGNHPEIVRGLFRVAKKLSEGGKVQGNPTQQKTDMAHRFYPGMN